MSQRLIMTRVVRGEFPGRDFDIEFWQRLGDAAIAAAAWDLVVLEAAQRGIGGDQLRLQRSVVAIQRPEDDTILAKQTANRQEDRIAVKRLLRAKALRSKRRR